MLSLDFLLIDVSGANLHSDPVGEGTSSRHSDPVGEGTSSWHSDRPVRSKKRKRCATSNDRADQRIEPSMCPCIYCCEEFVSSRPGEDWVKCDACQNWAHVLCSGYEHGSFVCDFCNM